MTHPRRNDWFDFMLLVLLIIMSSNDCVVNWNSEMSLAEMPSRDHVLFLDKYHFVSNDPVNSDPMT